MNQQVLTRNVEGEEEGVRAKAVEPKVQRNQIMRPVSCFDCAQMLRCVSLPRSTLVRCTSYGSAFERKLNCSDV